MQLFSDSCLEMHATTKMVNLSKIRQRVGRTQIECQERPHVSGESGDNGKSDKKLPKYAQVLANT